ncbi:hypothetical protein [Desulfolithobacter dissulfuricans]|nr:hypothetical protein [Desulfolithobacter dissulfuricans]
MALFSRNYFDNHLGNPTPRGDFYIDIAGRPQARNARDEKECTPDKTATV